MTDKRICHACSTISKSWSGDDRKCGFISGSFGDNWNCATVNKIRDIVFEGQAIADGVDYRYCGDQKYATIDIHDIECADDNPLALWVTWYKNRGRTEQMWFLFDHKPPREPTEIECLAVVAAYTGAKGATRAKGK